MSAGYTLYGLIARAEDGESTPNFSPYVWKTKLDLALLGVDHTNSGKSFAQIRGELAELLKNDTIRVPTLCKGDQTVSDSWVIAEYLEEKYAKAAGKSLFGTTPGSEDSKAFCKFIDNWANTQLASEMRPLLTPKVFGSLDPDSSAYFFKSRFASDSSKRDATCAVLNDKSFVASQMASARAKLGMVEAQLAYQQERGAKLWLLGGHHPTHADFSVFGWYAFSRLNKDLEGVWRDASLPLVGKWLDGILGSGLVDTKELSNGV